MGAGSGDCATTGGAGTAWGSCAGLAGAGASSGTSFMNCALAMRRNMPAGSGSGWP